MKQQLLTNPPLSPRVRNLGHTDRTLQEAVPFDNIGVGDGWSQVWQPGVCRWNSESCKDFIGGGEDRVVTCQ